MRKFLRFVVMSLVLVIVGVMSALTSMRIAIHGRETTVPNLVKLTAPEAERIAVSNGLQVALEGEFYSRDIAEGSIVSQTPNAGSRVRRGWTVRLARSLGPQHVVIPDVVGQSARAAELNVRQRGLDLGSVAQVQLPDQPPDVVVAQSPPANAPEVQSPRMSVLVSTQAEPISYVMPNFIGSPVVEAMARIQQAGFQVRVESAPPVPTNGVAPPPATSTNRVILHQNPAPGQRLVTGTVIQLQTNP